MRRAVSAALAVLVAGCAPTADHALHRELAAARADGVPFLIYAYGVPGEIEIGNANVAVPVYVQFVVTSPRSITRVEFTLVGYTRRGIPVRRHGKPMAVVLIGPGPFRPDGNYEVNSFHSQPAGFPGGDVACVAFAGAQITFEDGERVTMDVAQLRSSMLPALRKSCWDRGPQVDRLISIR